MKESRQGVRWIVEAVVLAMESSGSKSRQAGANAGTVSTLAGAGEALLLYAQGEAWQETAAAS